MPSRGARKKSTPFRKGLWLKRLLLVVASLGIVLGLVEGGLRLYTWYYVRSRLKPIGALADGAAMVYVLGDSVPAGYGLPPEQAWPAQLQTLLATRTSPPTVVYNAAQPGAGLMGLRTGQMDTLSSLRTGVPLVGLFQVGHNDRTSLMFHGQAFEEDTDEISKIWGEMRILRMLRSFEERRLRWQPPQTISDEGLARFTRDLGKLCSSFTAKGGSCIYATYPICGVIGQEQSSDYALEHNRTRAAQLTVNQLIRWAGEHDGVPVLDIAERVPLPISWSPDDCLDAIHPTARVHLRIAEVVADALLAGKEKKTE